MCCMCCMCCMLLALGKLQLLIRCGYSLCFFHLCYNRPRLFQSPTHHFSNMYLFLKLLTFFSEKCQLYLKHLDGRLSLLLCSAKPSHDHALGCDITVGFLLWNRSSPTLLRGLELVSYSFIWPLVWRWHTGRAFTDGVRTLLADHSPPLSKPEVALNDFSVQSLLTELGLRPTHWSSASPLAHFLLTCQAGPLHRPALPSPCTGTVVSAQGHRLSTLTP